MNNFGREPIAAHRDRGAMAATSLPEAKAATSQQVALGRVKHLALFLCIPASNVKLAN
jgi:hypothetical protein